MVTITLLTDFGTADSYVAEMKGVLRSLAPGVAVDDVAHDIPPGDVRAAAWVLSRYWRLWPAGTIHVAVVDPGVGSDRAIWLACADDRWLLAPDNGLLTGVVHSARDFVARPLRPYVRRAEGCSQTFHGRDIFAVAAARMAMGASPDELAGPAVGSIVLIPGWMPRLGPGDRIEGCVLHVDRFGNLVTNVRQADLPPVPWRLRLGSSVMRGLRETYASVAPGEPLLYIGSAGHLEIAVRDGSAASQFGVQAGEPVVIEPDIS